MVRLNEVWMQKFSFQDCLQSWAALNITIVVGGGSMGYTKIGVDFWVRAWGYRILFKAGMSIFW